MAGKDECSLGIVLTVLPYLYSLNNEVYLISLRWILQRKISLFVIFFYKDVCFETKSSRNNYRYLVSSSYTSKLSIFILEITYGII